MITFLNNMCSYVFHYSREIFIWLLKTLADNGQIFKYKKEDLVEKIFNFKKILAMKSKSRFILREFHN